MIRVHGLAKEFIAKGANNHVMAVDDVSFEVPTGSFFTLLGPSGCGKTTTLRCVAGLERPTAGTVELDSVVVCSDRVFLPSNKRDIGMVFQSYAVWPHLTVFENVAFPLRVVKEKLAEKLVRSRVEDTLALVGLDGLNERRATQLSGGQQQRLSLARALVNQPSCLLFDEPLSNLDAKLRERMRTELSEIQKELGFTALYVTHDQIEALTLSDEIAVMHQGRIAQRGTPDDIYFRPRSRLVAEFIGSTNILAGTLRTVSVETGAAEVETPVGLMHCRQGGDLAGMSPGSSVLMAVRPEDVAVASPATESHAAVNEMKATITRTSFAGAATEAVAEVDGTALRVQASARAGLHVGDRVRLVIHPDACRILPVEALGVDPAPSQFPTVAREAVG